MRGAGENGTPYIRYEYNIDGQRTKKILQYPDMDTPITTEYFYNSGMLMGQKTGDDVLQFMYDESGDIFGFIYNGDAYYYLKNAQNDVWAVTNADGQAVVLCGSMPLKQIKRELPKATLPQKEKPCIH